MEEELPRAALELRARLDFRPAFDEGDEVLATYAKLVEGIPAW